MGTEPWQSHGQVADLGLRQSDSAAPELGGGAGVDVGCDMKECGGVQRREKECENCDWQTSVAVAIDMWPCKPVCGCLVQCRSLGSQD